MSAGVCVLASDTPENLEALGDTGFTFKRCNVADLRRMLTYLLDNDQLRAKFGGRAQERVRENFLWDDVVGELAGIYARMVSRDEKRATIALRLSPSVASVIEIGRPSTNYKAHEGKPMEPAVDQEMPRSVRAAR